MAIVDAIRFDGLKSKDWFIYKYPVENLTTDSQLIVQEGQRAIFVKHGMVADSFEPGTYTLHSENIPILRSIVNIPFGGVSPFSAEIYFVNTIVRMDIYWGTSDPIQLIDPKYSVKLRVRAFGQMNIKVVDAEYVFRTIIGGMQPSEIVSYERVKKFIKGMLDNKVKSVLAEAIITNKISALEISTKIEDLSASVFDKIKNDIKESGFECIHFYIQSINFPDEDFERINKILENKAEFDIMGDNRYLTKRSFDVYETAAGNNNGVAGTFASMGVGAGVGYGIGQTMQNTVTGNLSNTSMKSCVSCGEMIPASARFCQFCGSSNEERFCSECGTRINRGMKFCSRCGKKLMEV